MKHKRGWGEGKREKEESNIGQKKKNPACIRKTIRETCNSYKKKKIIKCLEVLLEDLL